MALSQYYFKHEGGGRYVNHAGSRQGTEGGNNVARLTEYGRWLAICGEARALHPSGTSRAFTRLSVRGSHSHPRPDLSKTAIAIKIKLRPVASLGCGPSALPSAWCLLWLQDAQT